MSELFKKSRKMNENFVTFRLIVFRFNATTIRLYPFYQDESTLKRVNKCITKLSLDWFSLKWKLTGFKRLISMSAMPQNHVRMICPEFKAVIWPCMPTFTFIPNGFWRRERPIFSRWNQNKDLKFPIPHLSPLIDCVEIPISEKQLLGNTFGFICDLKALTYIAHLL